MMLLCIWFELYWVVSAFFDHYVQSSAQLGLDFIGLGISSFRIKKKDGKMTLLAPLSFSSVQFVKFSSVQRTGQMLYFLVALITFKSKLSTFLSDKRLFWLRAYHSGSVSIFF